MVFRDILRRKVSENMKAEELWRNQAEIQTTENFETLKVASDQLAVSR